MSAENIRVSELAKKLNLTSKDVLAKFAVLSISLKSASNSVTPEQVSKLEAFIANGSKLEVKKPKAFIVKKAKNTDTKATIVEKGQPIEKVEEKKPSTIAKSTEKASDFHRNSTSRIGVERLPSVITLGTVRLKGIAASWSVVDTVIVNKSLGI